MDGPCRYAARASVPGRVLRQDLAAAVGMGASVSEVLRAQHVSRGTYYRWLAIGRGDFVEWWDGCPIDAAMQACCWELAVGITRARLQREQVALDRLVACTPTEHCTLGQ